MTTYTTITGQEIKVSANQSKRTFTIRKNSSKYRSYPMRKEDFNHAWRNWTGNDWSNFLGYDGEYYSVK